MIAAIDLFAPEGGYTVRILDLSGGAEDNFVEDIKGFASLIQANAFAARYVRDSLERCRSRGMAPRAVLDAWFAYGEDALVLDAGEAGWRSASEIAVFAETQAGREARDWRALDPRLIGPPLADQDEPPPDEDAP